MDKKRKDIDNQSEQNKRIKVVSKKIKGINKAPEQVLKLLVYYQQEEINKLVQRINQLETTINNSNIWSCGECNRYCGYENGEKCYKCNKEMCYLCYEDHRGLIKCQECNKDLHHTSKCKVCEKRLCVKCYSNCTCLR